MLWTETCHVANGGTGEKVQCKYVVQINEILILMADDRRRWRPMRQPRVTIQAGGKEEQVSTKRQHNRHSKTIHSFIIRGIHRLLLCQTYLVVACSHKAFHGLDEAPVGGMVDVAPSVLIQFIHDDD